MNELNNFKPVQEQHSSSHKATEPHMHHADADLSMNSDVHNLRMKHSCSIITMSFYRLDEQFPQIQAELELRRNKNRS